MYANALLDPVVGGLGRLESAPAHSMPVSDGLDATLLMRTRFRGGFMLSMDNRAELGDGHSMRIGSQAFGHCGSGGSIGFADPELGLSVGYTMNKQGQGTLLNERGRALVDAIYRSLGQTVPSPPARRAPQLEQDQR